MNGTRRDRRAVQPDILYQNYVLPPRSTTDVPADCMLTKFVRAAMNKIKCPIYCLCVSQLIYSTFIACFSGRRKENV
jgi:hypothetical protein